MTIRDEIKAEAMAKHRNLSLAEACRLRTCDLLDMLPHETAERYTRRLQFQEMNPKKRTKNLPHV